MRIAAIPLSEDHLRELSDAVQSIAESDARGVVLAAEGPVFSSGHDFNDMHGRDLNEMKRLLAFCGEFMQLLQCIPQPVIAQVEGLATAAGCQLVASCDLAVAGESVRFSDARRRRRVVLPHTRCGAGARSWSKARGRNAAHR
ncbi:MAG: hypothetical protein CM1200mP36_00810 [Gammaproteobacteria bacterium]|nr:MAG: hypothetical protein CM1200mP36_00810 [Gammaproteobacteria bacterium]